MKLQFSHPSLLTGFLLTALSALPLSAQPSPATDAAKPSTSAGVADILNMLDHQVSPDVIKTYIETSANSFEVSPTDLIALKDHKVTDEITVALLKHSSSAAAPAAAPSVNQSAAAAPAPIRTYVINSTTDPESYAFFQRNYLMPRTQANINETLGYASVPYGNTFVPYYPPGVYAYGLNAGPGFGGGFGGGFALGGRNAFNVGRGLSGGFIVRRQ